GQVWPGFFVGVWGDCKLQNANCKLERQTLSDPYSRSRFLMADIITRGDNFSVLIPNEGEFHVDQSWIDGLKRKLEKRFDANFEVKLNSSASCLNVNI